MTMTKDEMDAEANYFARCLLMPREFLLRDLRALDGFSLTEDDDIKRLAKKYGVSMGMLAIRIHEVANGID